MSGAEAWEVAFYSPLSHTHTYTEATDTPAPELVFMDVSQ